MAGKKQTEGKIPFHLLSGPALEGIAQVLEYGMKKYDARNWEAGIPYDKIFQAMQRHLWKFWSGHDIDDETGLSHVAHAACLSMFLLHFVKCSDRYAMFDNRPIEHHVGISNDGNPAKQEGLE